MERRAERATALGGARVLAISVASIRGKIDHPGAATTGGRSEVAKPFQTDESRKPFFPARFRDLAMRSESDWGRQSVDSSRPWPVHFSASYGLLPCRTSHRLPTEGTYGTQKDCSPRVAQILGRADEIKKAARTDAGATPIECLGARRLCVVRKRA